MMPVLATILLLFVAYGEALPVKDVTPGCQTLCTAYPGSFTDCTKDCPTVQSCQAAVDRGTVEEYYTQESEFHQPGPLPCEDHCWPDTIFTEKTCMIDCPMTWCLKYSGVDKTPSSTTTTITTTNAPETPTPVTTSVTTVTTDDVTTNLTLTPGPMTSSRGRHTVVVVLSALGGTAAAVVAVGVGIKCWRRNRHNGKPKAYHSTPTEDPKNNELRTSGYQSTVPVVNKTSEHQPES